MGIGNTYEGQPGLRQLAPWLALGVPRGWPDVITSRVVRAPRQGLSPGCRASRRPLGARDASQACVGVDAGRACSIQTIEALCRLWTQGSAGFELGTLRSSTSLRQPHSRVNRMATGRHKRVGLGCGEACVGGIETEARAALSSSTPQRTADPARSDDPTCSLTRRASPADHRSSS